MSTTSVTFFTEADLDEQEIAAVRAMVAHYKAMCVIREANGSDVEHWSHSLAQTAGISLCRLIHMVAPGDEIQGFCDPVEPEVLCLDGEEIYAGIDWCYDEAVIRPISGNSKNSC